MIDINEIIKKAQSKQYDIQDAKHQQRVECSMSDKQFATLFKIETRSMLIRKQSNKEFEFDDNNKPIVRQLYLWLIKGAFSGNENKGFLLTGNIGCGKTLIMESFIRIYNYFCDDDPTKKIKIYDSRELFYKIIEDGVDVYASGVLYIDDLGKEPIDYTNYGFTKQPMIELLSLRHSLGRLTFASGNFTLDGYYKEKYGKTIVDRFKEMFNHIELKGESKR